MCCLPLLRPPVVTVFFRKEIDSMSAGIALLDEIVHQPLVCAVDHELAILGRNPWIEACRGRVQRLAGNSELIHETISKTLLHYPFTFTGSNGYPE